MAFPAAAYLASAAAGGFVTLLAVPLWRAWCRRTGLVDDPGHRKIHAQPMPLAGGLALLTGILVPILAAIAAIHFNLLESAITEKLRHGFDRRAGQLSALLFGALGMTFLGWLDDKHELRPVLKFTGQLCIACLVAAAGIRITLFVPSVLFSYAITVLWILTVTNAFNFLDNMNGLCAGLGAIAAALVGLLAAGQQQYLVALLAFLIAGAAVGFLPYNFPRASTFLGDAGSHLLGFLLAVLGILPHYYSAKNQHTLAVLSPLLLLAVPLGDLLWVVLLRWRLGRPFYVGDTNHLSHRLVRRGLSSVTAVVVIWLLALAMGLLSFIL